MKNVKEYYLGLDIGTSSIGWAVTDNKYNLMRAKGKDLWGVRLFKEAETGAKRRSFRISRRRRQREVARIGLLKEMFADEINKLDPNFFQRLEESKYHHEDKSINSKYALFSDEFYSDTEHNKKYPTIFHLRKELIESKESHDVRIVYLAILNIFKHRGHFLSSSLNAEQKNGMEVLFVQLENQLSELLFLSMPLITESENLTSLLSGKGMSRTKIAEKVAELLGFKRTKDKTEYEVIKAICGLTINIDAIFGEDFLDDEGKRLSLSFRDSDYDEKISKINDVLGEEYSDILDSLKQVHDQALLANVMQGHQYLSYARVESYEKHRADLLLLKKVIKEYCPAQYDSFFRSDDDGSYSAYIGSVNSDLKRRRGMGNGKAEDIYSTVKKILKECPNENPAVDYILKEIESENFLPKQRTSANGAIPNQVHMVELRAILTNAEKYMPFLKEVDETGLSVSNKIESLFEFKVPYYIGPLNDYHKNNGGNAWIVRNESGPIYPWNLEQMVDTQKTSEVFIERLIRKCTYMTDQLVLPKASLLYERFVVLNELNNLRIRGEKPSAEIKQSIFQSLFLSGKKVSRKKLLNYLVGIGLLNPDEVDAVSGIDGDFVNSLGTYGKFKTIFGNDVDHDDVKMMVERIVFWGTIYGDDKKFYQETLTREYGNQLTSDVIKRISGFKFKDWGRLSREFLEMEGLNKETGEMLSLIQMMWHYNDNLMELLSDRYTYTEQLTTEYNALTKSLFEISYEDIDGLYLSAPVKRMVWQTLLIVKELEEVLQGAPSRIFVEMARENGEKGRRTTSRKQRLLELYRSCKDDVRNWTSELESLDDARLKSKKLYLYYTQKGRCLYTGEAIDLDDLFNENLYDIDHIYPRRFVKDDSLENNLVLVKKEVNAHKSDQYPIEDSIVKNQQRFWKSLLTKDLKDGFITREKYQRLINRNPLSDDQLTAFINRQLVETRQGTKAITQILGQYFCDSEMVFVKAGNISDFRHDFDLLKVRSVNDFHHAQDAYLSVVVGNSYLVKFTKNPANFIKQFRKNAIDSKYHMTNLFKNDIRRGEEIAWIADSKAGNSITSVKRVMERNTPLVTKMTYEGHGELYNATVYSAEKTNEDAYVSLKTSDRIISDIKKYGGYSSVSTAHFFLVEHEIKGKMIRTLEALPLIHKNVIDQDIIELEKYCIEKLKIKNPNVRLTKIKLQSLIKRDGFFLNITGKTVDRLIVSNALPLKVNRSWMNYIKKIEKSLNDRYPDTTITKKLNSEMYESLLIKHTNEIYRKRPNPIGEMLLKGRDKFFELIEIDQCFVLSQILQLSQLNNLGADLRLIGGSKSSGISLISKNITKAKEFKLIQQSIAGLHRDEIDLLTI